ncbi:MAG: iron-containing alcohol dehydrogenase [Candidatus Dormibacteria bacterium]
MTSTYTSSPARRVRFGVGALGELKGEREQLGVERPLLAISASLARDADLMGQIWAQLGGEAQVPFTGLSQHTPEEAVTQLVDRLEAGDHDGVVSLGGGSVIDGVKVAIHRLGRRLPHLAIPTTLSGAEFTPTAGITAGVEPQKVGLKLPEAAPRTVILDPRLSLATPERLWLATGVRALDHAVETVWSPEQDPLLTHLAEEAIRRLRALLPECRHWPEALATRGDLQVAAWWAALGLAGATMGPSHTLSRLLGASFGIPHGITSCVLLPVVVRAQAAVAPAQVEPIARALGVRGPEEVAPELEGLIAGLGLPTSLAGAGLAQEQLPRYLGSLPEEWREAVAAAF